MLRKQPTEKRDFLSRNYFQTIRRLAYLTLELIVKLWDLLQLQNSGLLNLKKPSYAVKRHTNSISCYKMVTSVLNDFAKSEKQTKCLMSFSTKITPKIPGMRRTNTSIGPHCQGSKYDPIWQIFIALFNHAYALPSYISDNCYCKRGMVYFEQNSGIHSPNFLNYQPEIL